MCDFCDDAVSTLVFVISAFCGTRDWSVKAAYKTEKARMGQTEPLYSLIEREFSNESVMGNLPVLLHSDRCLEVACLVDSRVCARA